MTAIYLLSRSAKVAPSWRLGVSPWRTVSSGCNSKVELRVSQNAGNSALRIDGRHDASSPSAAAFTLN